MAYYKKDTDLQQKKYEFTKAPRFLQSVLTREEALNRLKTNPGVYHDYLQLSPLLQEQCLAFCMGMRGLPVIYDPFFKKIMDPETHPDRLSEFLSDLLGIPVRVRRILPAEGNRLSGSGSLVIMDIIVELEDGSYTDVEIQKTGYHFPGQRTQCYASDMVMRQYNRVKYQSEEEGRRFSFRDLKKVYMLILMEKSSSEFTAVQPQYEHKQVVTYSSGASVTSLTDITYLSLDIFNENVHNITTKKDAWLKFLSSDNPDDILQIISRYPRFRELYEEISQFRTNPKELIGMFSEALRIMDANTVQLMIDEQREELAAQRKELEENKKELEQNKKELEQNQKELEQNKKELEENQKELEQSQNALSESTRELEARSKELEAQRLENLELKRMIAQLEKARQVKTD